MLTYHVLLAGASAGKAALTRRCCSGSSSPEEREGLLQRCCPAAGVPQRKTPAVVVQRSVVHDGDSARERARWVNKGEGEGETADGWILVAPINLGCNSEKVQRSTS